MREMLLAAAKSYYVGHINKHIANVEVYLRTSVGIGEHSDIIESIDKELVIESMESAIQKAALTKFGNDNNIEVIIDRESGEIKIQKVLEIVDKVEDPAREITLIDAQKTNSKNNNLKVGEKISEDLPQIDFE